MSIGAPPCAVSRFITLSSSSGLATVPASSVLGDSVVVVKPGRNDRATGPIGPPTWSSWSITARAPGLHLCQVRVRPQILTPCELPDGVEFDAPALQSVDDADQRGLVRDGASEHRFDGLSNDPDVVEFCQD